MGRAPKVAAASTAVVGALLMIAAFFVDFEKAYRFESSLLLVLPFALVPVMVLQLVARGRDGRWGRSAFVVLVIAVVAMLLFSLVPISSDLSDGGGGDGDADPDLFAALLYGLSTLAFAVAAALGALGIVLLAVGMARLSRRHSVLTLVTLFGYLVSSYGVFGVGSGSERVGLVLAGVGLFAMGSAVLASGVNLRRWNSAQP